MGGPQRYYCWSIGLLLTSLLLVSAKPVNLSCLSCLFIACSGILAIFLLFMDNCFYFWIYISCNILIILFICRAHLKCIIAKLGINSFWQREVSENWILTSRERKPPGLSIINRSRSYTQRLFDTRYQVVNCLILKWHGKNTLKSPSKMVETRKENNIYTHISLKYLKMSGLNLGRKN